jgi:hypothetical protein
VDSPLTRLSLQVSGNDHSALIRALPMLFSRFFTLASWEIRCQPVGATFSATGGRGFIGVAYRGQWGGRLDPIDEMRKTDCL